MAMITTLASFNYANGTEPISGVIADGGDLFGVMFHGGAHDLGTVFKIAKTADGYAGALLPL